MEKTWRPPTRDEVLNAIVDSGYPLEVRVSRLLDENSYTVTPGWNYYDQDSGKSKEIDLVGQMELGAAVVTTVHLLISCKMKKSGLVVFESAPPVLADGMDPEDLYVFGRPKWIYRSRDHNGAGHRTGDVLGWTTEAWAPAAVTANQFAAIRQQGQTKEVRWIADHGDLYQRGILPLFAGLQVYRQRHGQSAEGVAYLNFAALLLIVDGPLWSFRVGKGHSSPRRVKTESYYRHYADVRTPATYRVDFVQSRHLPAYLAQLNTSQKALVAKITALAEDICYSATRSPH